MIRGTTRLLGVIGDPVSHSLSPVMHNAAIAHLGVDYVYLPLPVKADQLHTALEGFAAIGLRGFNITIPHKQHIMPLLTEISEAAQAIGAVNTVWHTEAGWSGTNTDVDGFKAPLAALDRDWSSTPALVLGNGGAARAVVVACAQLGVPSIQVVGRSLDKLVAFKQSWENSFVEPLMTVHHWDALEQLLPSARLIVNTTPVGMAHDASASPLSPDLTALMSPEAIAYDLIYTPRPTRFLKEAAEQGAIAIDGLEMLVQQGAAALKIWLRQDVPVDIMRDSLLSQMASPKT
ncbi:MAG: shikimate dehydrogenase [Elainellaceae cyanobacterium]